MFFFDKGLLAMGNVREGVGWGGLGEWDEGWGGGGGKGGEWLHLCGGGRRRPPLAHNTPRHTRTHFPPQLLFLSGVALTIGPRSTLRFFTRRRNARGSAFFGAGLVLVLAGWAVVGMAVEAYGFWLLFAGFFPTVLGFLRRAPGLGPVLDAPVLKSVRVCEREGRCRL
jgi:hypothetical protein